jgi:hypothetical protein
MAKLPELPGSPTAKAIHDRYLGLDDWRRDHLGASVIGRPCDRELFYIFRWVTNPNFPGRVLRLFERGQREERWILSELRALGLEVWDQEPGTSKQMRVKWGHFGGSCDGIVRGVLEAPKTPHLLEVKTINEKGHKELSSKGVQHAKPEHFAQMQVYMHGLKLTRALYLSVCKNNDEIYVERVYYSKDIAEHYLARAERIINADRPPEKISDDPGWYQCRWCNFAPTCHGDALPEINCRTCCSSTPHEDGTWRCSLFLDAIIPPDFQRIGCMHHLFNPYLMPWEVDDAGEDWVSYVDGPRNGAGGLSSKELIEV